MRDKIQRAMILAAGYGTRMQPLTDHTPKPLIPVAGKPMIAYALEKLKEYGIREVIINVSHHKDQLLAYLATYPGLAIKISEEAEPLETGGGLKKALPLLGDEPFFTINSDIIWIDSLSPTGGEGRGEGLGKQISNFELRTSNVQHPTSNIEHSTECLPLPLGGEGRGEGAGLGKQTSNVERRTSNIQHSTLNAQRSTQHFPATSLERLTYYWDASRMDILLLTQSRAKAIGYDRGEDHLFIKPGHTFEWDEREAPYIIASVGIVHPRLFQDAPDGKFSVKVLWQKALAQHRLACVPHRGPWFQTGTPADLVNAENFLRKA